MSTLPELEPGDKVWVPLKSSNTGIVRKSSEPRSFVLKTEQPHLRRNRKHLVLSPNEAIGSASGKDSPEREACDKDLQEPHNCTGPGRMVIAPTRLNL